MGIKFKMKFLRLFNGATFKHYFTYYQQSILYTSMKIYNNQLLNKNILSNKNKYLTVIQTVP